MRWTLVNSVMIAAVFLMASKCGGGSQPTATDKSLEEPADTAAETEYADPLSEQAGETTEESTQEGEPSPSDEVNPEDESYLPEEDGSLDQQGDVGGSEDTEL